MALKFVTIGSLGTIHVYDDAVTLNAVETDGIIESSHAPVAGDEMVRLADIVAPGDGVGAAANITDHAIVRGDGGAKNVQDSLVFIDDAGNIILQALATVDGIDISVHAANVNAHHNQVHIITSHSDAALVGLANNDLMQWNDPGSIWQAKDIAEIILGQDIAPGDVTSSGMVRQANTWHAYGGFEDAAELIACGAGTWHHITNGAPTFDLWNLDEGAEISLAADVLTLDNTAHYIGNLSLSISGLNGKDFHVRVYNNTQARVEGRPIGISTTGANNEMNVSVPIFIEGTAGDEIQFEIMSTDGSDPVVDDGIFIIAYLHD